MFPLADITPLDQAWQDILRAGIIGAVLIVVISASVSGWIEWRPSIKVRDEVLTDARKQRDDAIALLKDEVNAMNRIADGIEERNRIESASRKRA